MSIRITEIKKITLSALTTRQDEKEIERRNARCLEGIPRPVLEHPKRKKVFHMMQSSGRHANHILPFTADTGTSLKSDSILLVFNEHKRKGLRYHSIMLFL
ncbi:hypothetical protein CDAR_193801 [Caerostris darwini]|uniref:Uncharacterized protein n=1 Tax=Caerostris darwini TaxID=1538125 RepID=A0AAV4UP18_9ARAC|nr:hypothetical protein CDAR_193801 [Caerostris darwini]